MALNDARLTPSAATAIRHPLLQVIVQSTGQVIKSVIKATVRNVGHFHADTFSAEFSLNDPICNLAWWGSNQPIILQIQIGFATTDTYGPSLGTAWQTMIVGQVDHIQAHLSTRTMSVEGRDLSANLIDLKIQDAYPNKTSSEIATILATKAGLTPNVKKTTELAGTYYQGDHDTITNDEFSRTTTAWDLLTNLAEREQFDLWVSGTTLNFQPLTANDPTPWLVNYKPPTIKPSSSYGTFETGIDLTVDRSLTLAKDIVVVVQGWNSSTEKMIKATYPSGKNTSLHAAKSTLQQYVVRRANLKNEQEALTIAQAKYKDLVLQERIVEWREPGDLTLTPRNMAQLSGTNSSWDGPYFIDTITREISMEEGFVMSIRAKNKSTQSQTVVG